MAEEEEEISEEERELNIMVELVLYKQVSMAGEIYLRENMTPGYKHTVVAKARPMAEEAVKEFCEEYNVKPEDVISKLKRCLPRPGTEHFGSEQSRITERIIKTIEARLQKQKERDEGR